MKNEDRESPSSSPVPGPSRQRPQEAEDDLSLGGEAEPYRAPDQDEELGLAGPSYRYMEEDGNSPAPSHSGLDADYGMLGLPQESPLSRHFDTVFTVSSSPSAPCSSSSSGYIQSSFPGAPMTSSSTSRARVPGHSSDPVFSAHSQPLHSELLNYPDLPISSSWGVGASGQDSAQMRPSASWGSEAGASGLEQEVPGDLSLEAREDQDRSLQWGASSSNGMGRPDLDYSEENSMEAEVHQGFNQYQSVSNESSSFSPQPSSSASSVSGSMLSRGGPSSMVSNDRSLADILAVGPSLDSSASIELSVPGPSRNQMMSIDTEASNSAKRPRSFPDSPSPSLIDQNKRLRLYEEGQGSSDYYHNAVSSNARYDGAGPSPSQPNEVIVISNPASPQLQDGPSESIPISMANQINREIENCLREDAGMGSRSNSIDMEPPPGPSRGQQSVARASFGSVASSVSYLGLGNEPQPGPSRGLFGAAQNNGQMFQPAQQGPPSPTGSEVLAAGPSRAMEQIDLQDSPSGSEVEAAGSNQRRQAVNNPNSPAPSESDPDEAGPSNQGYMVRFGRQQDDPSNREAAPRGRPVSPERRRRARRNFSDACQISSSTGPVDSNPPSPDMYGVNGDIDYDYSPSPQHRRYNARYDDNNDAVVDSTVDSTNTPYVIHDYEDNEVRDIDDNDEDTEDESVAGSEASSTTSSRSRIDDHRLSLPGQDDNEGISTSGQVDVGQFRLVPNDIEMNFDEAFHENSVPAHVSVPFQEEIEEIILNDNPLPAQIPVPPPEPQQVERSAEVTFKKPFNRKERIMENVNIELEQVAGPSGLQNSTSNPEEMHSGSSSSSLYPDLRLGLAFSGLPSSLSQPKSKPAEETASNAAGMSSHNIRPVPLKLKLKSRHLKDQLNSKSSFGSGEETGGNSAPIQYHSTDILRSSLERGLPSSAVSVSNAQEVDARPEPLLQAEPTNGNAVDENGEIETNSNLGGVQQNFSVTLETSNHYLSSIKPKRIMQTKSAAELKEYLPLDESLNNDDEDIESLDSFLHQDQSLDLEDTPYLTPKKAMSQENSKCKEKEETGKQVTEAGDQEITIMISDQPVQSRAVASLPTQYLSLRPVQGQEQGVFAVRDIPVSCRFGPIEGRLVDPGQDVSIPIGLALIIQGQRLDVSYEEDSNWMRFIRAAASTEEQNLSLHEVNGQLYFTSTRPIGPNEELRVWYSEAYATQHSLPLKPTKISTGQPVACPKKRPQISPTVGQHLAEKTKRDSGGPSFTCDICQRKFERQASLLRHLALHKGDKNYTCPDCGQKFSHTFNLERHRKKAHNTDPEGQHVCCNVCSVWFPSNMVLKIHMFSHHPNKEEQNWTVEDAMMAQAGKDSSEQDHEEMKFQCPCEDCKCQYDTWLQLVEHAMDHGSPVLPSSNNNPTKSPIHKCELCYKIFANDARLKKHMAVHEGDSNKPLSCDDCGKRFLTNSALAGHIKIHAHPDTLYDCPMCGQEFEQVSSLKEHVYDHKENGVFTCQHCEKTFSEYPQIRKHIRAFHAEKRFPCTICDKSFTGKDKLKVHMVRHSEQKDFACQECDKQFKRKDKLREHEKRMHKAVDNDQPSVNPEASCSKFVPKVINICCSGVRSNNSNHIIFVGITNRASQVYLQMSDMPTWIQTERNACKSFSQKTPQCSSKLSSRA